MTVRSARLAILFLLLAAAFAASAESLLPREPSRAWAQRADELGKLVVGRVVAVEEHVEAVAALPPGPPEIPKWGAMFGLAGFAVANAVTSGPKKDSEFPQANAYFRYTVLLDDSEEQVVRDEYAKFQLGSCVALRAEPQMMVPAYPGACR